MKNQKGIAVVAVILLIVLVGLVGATGWYVYSSNKNTNKSLTNAQSAANSTVDSSKTSTNTNQTTKTEPNKAVDIYKDWKEYCSPKEKSCFKYPSSWTLTNNFTSDFDSTGNNIKGYDSVTVSSPGGSKIYWSTFKSGLGGGCTPDPSNTIFLDKVSKSAFNDSVYLVQSHTGQNENNQIVIAYYQSDKPLQTGSTGGCLVYFNFTSKQNATEKVWLYSDVSNVNDLNDIINSLKSYKYN